MYDVSLAIVLISEFTLLLCVELWVVLVVLESLFLVLDVNLERKVGSSSYRFAAARPAFCPLEARVAYCSAVEFCFVHTVLMSEMVGVSVVWFSKWNCTIIVICCLFQEFPVVILLW